MFQTDTMYTDLKQRTSDHLYSDLTTSTESMKILSYTGISWRSWGKKQFQNEIVYLGKEVVSLPDLI